MKKEIPQNDQHLQRQREELVDAAQANDHARIKAALLTPAATVTDEWGRTALMDVVRFHKSASVESVRLLLSGSDPKAQDRRGITPLMMAINSGRADLVELLLPVSDANARDSAGFTALMNAFPASATKIVPSLIAAGDPKAVNDWGWSALMFAASCGDIDGVRLLLPVSDASVRSTHKTGQGHGVGWTALMIAAFFDKPECVALLLPVSNPKTQGARRATALSLAIRRGNAKCADLLAEHSERDEADRAFKKFGAKMMPRWAARLEAEAIAQEINAVDCAMEGRKSTVPVARAKATRI